MPSYDSESTITTFTKPTVVIAHGAWQPLDIFTSFAEQLVTAGHQVEVVALPSIDHDSLPVPGLREDCEAVAETLSRRADEGEEIILLCHSYGGLVGSCAAEGQDVVYRKTKLGKEGGVVLIIYMSAFMVPKGKSLLDALGGKPSEWMDVQDDKVYCRADRAYEVALNDLPKEKAGQYIEHLRHASIAAFATPATYEPWAHGIPCAYILSKLDGGLPFPAQQMMASQIGNDAMTFTLQAGHCAFLSMPEQVIDAISKASAALQSKKNT